jgi:diaminohydroxyphosphoribosylaminopyrimidine deaminase/5-amino-6-(5-phosphoribosylamino)uracil reductase
MNDTEHMRRAIAAAETVRETTAPNPWVGSVLVPAGDPDLCFIGATAPPGGAHAEVDALAQAGPDLARGATLFTTLEPCAHQGRTPPCTDAVIAAGVARVVIGLEDPDPLVAGRGAEALRAAGIEVTIGVAADEVAEQLAPYLKHRLTGQPWVVLKMAASLDARTAAPDGSSRWITGEAARHDAHRLRARSDAVLVGAGTVRSDDPELTVRLDDGATHRQPLRVVLGTAPAEARVHPALELSGDLGEVLRELGRRGVLQLLVEGGARVAHDFHAAGLVDRYVLYLAPVLFGGDDALPLFAGPGAGTLADVWRGKLVSVERLGEDLRVEVAA